MWPVKSDIPREVVQSENSTEEVYVPVCLLNSCNHFPHILNPLVPNGMTRHILTAIAQNDSIFHGSGQRNFLSMAEYMAPKP